ncbi:hypothetical protein NECAME_09753 [Necator americanus]|uniref:Uncharacterized protein n=1 Tax=Necator americanus TaxID=51031 RepID=W2TEY7_NECAM|nr:hypothetical protein NECAME_09753 [Necator americanus]ETN79577.1 hypothetical protein NECAME_09753 [Necator americanus]
MTSMEHADEKAASSDISRAVEQKVEDIKDTTSSDKESVSAANVRSKAAETAEEVTTQETSSSREQKKTDTLRSTRGNGETKRRCTIL